MLHNRLLRAETLINADIRALHPRGTEPAPRGTDASRGCVRSRMTHRCRHVIHITDQRASDSILYDLRKGAPPEGNHRRAAGQGLHRSKGACLVYQRGNEQASRGLQELALRLDACRPGEHAPIVEARLYLFGEIALVICVWKDLARNHKIRIGSFCRLDREMNTFFRANTGEDKGMGALHLRLRPEPREIDAVFDWRQQISDCWAAGVLAPGHAIE